MGSFEHWIVRTRKFLSSTTNLSGSLSSPSPLFKLLTSLLNGAVRREFCCSFLAVEQVPTRLLMNTKGFFGSAIFLDEDGKGKI